MADNIFYLKKNDTRPSLQVTLKNPDSTVHDLTGNTAISLYIKLANGIILTRLMTVVGAPTAGIVKYDWVTTDWDAGKLYGGTFAPSTQFYIDHKMEYEVVTASTRTTFPNNNYDILRISADLGNS